MQINNDDVIATAHNWLTQKKDIWLCTILSTYGSAPRGVGSVFLTDGHVRVGSISGGCLEDAFVKMIGQGRFTHDNEIFVYGNHLSDADIVRELPCGGTIRLLVERFQTATSSQDYLVKWAEMQKGEKAFNRTISLVSGDKQLNFMPDKTQLNVEENKEQVVISYAQAFSLLLVGIGPVTQYIAQFGLQAGFNVRVCDMRRELADSWAFAKLDGGVDIDWMSPDLFVEKYATSHSAVLALAHDPRLDDAALMEVFATDAFYIGAMGSKRTSANRLERLERICEITPDQLNRLHAPIGLHIGSKTPVEIAISTMADIIRVKNQIDRCDV